MKFGGRKRKSSARSLAAARGWETRRARERARSRAAEKGWETRRKNEEAARRAARPKFPKAYRSSFRHFLARDGKTWYALFEGVWPKGFYPRKTGAEQEEAREEEEDGDQEEEEATETVWVVHRAPEDVRSRKHAEFWGRMEAEGEYRRTSKGARALSLTYHGVYALDPDVESRTKKARRYLVGKAASARAEIRRLKRRVVELEKKLKRRGKHK